MTDLLDLLDAVADDTSPLGQDHYELIVDAFRQAARLDAGIVDPNRVRALLAEGDGYAVGSQQLSAAYCRARATSRGRTPLLERHDWTINTDTRGRNAGKWLRTYRWIGGPL